MKKLFAALEDIFVAAAFAESGQYESLREHPVLVLRENRVAAV